MMATYTVQFVYTCTRNINDNTGFHIIFDVLRDGSVVRRISIPRDDILSTDLTWESVLPFFLRETVKRSGATTLAQAKTAVEAAEWSF